MNFIKKYWLQILASTMLFLAFLPFSYSYYQILRWVVGISSGILAYTSFNNGRNVIGWIFIFSLILFNPIEPIHFMRETWQVLNLIFGSFYLYSIKKVHIIQNKK